MHGKFFFRTCIIAACLFLWTVTGALADVTDVHVDMSSARHDSFPVTFSPDNDGIDDFLNFVFTASTGGDGRDYRVVVDTVRDSALDPVTDWSQTTDKDWTWTGYADHGQAMYVWWEGRDMQWRTLPNGTYQVWIQENQGTWESPDWQTADDSMSVVISTKYITGTVTDANGDPLNDVRVNAGSQDAWGEAVTDGSGRYTISGLKATSAEPYHVNADKDGYFFKPVPENNNGQVSLPAAPGHATYDITMTEAVTFTVAATLNTVFNPGSGGSLWLWADAHNTQGPGWGNGNGEIANGGSDTTITINVDPEDLRAGSTWTLRVTGEYSMWDETTHQETRFSYTGSKTFTLLDTAGSVDANDDEVADSTIGVTLTKATAMEGTIILPSAPAQGMHLDVRARDTSNPANEAWGWGQVEQGATTGTFRIPALSAGTYDLFVRVDGYKGLTLENITVGSDDVDIDELFSAAARTLDDGESITGSIKLILPEDGDISDLPWQGEGSLQNIYLWLDAWTPGDFNWHGVNLQLKRGENDAEGNIIVNDTTEVEPTTGTLLGETRTWFAIPFNLAGLEALDYELHSWLQGFETTVDGDRPWEGRLAAGTTTASVELLPFSGSISGSISGPGSFTNVSIIANPLWGGGCEDLPEFISVESDGSYEITGLGTGEYVVLVDEYAGEGISSGNYAMQSSGVFVTNGQATTGVDFTLSTPNTLTVTVTGYESGDEAVFAPHADAVVPVAMPMELSMMPGNLGMIMGQPDGSGGYDLKLGDGTYTVTFAMTDQSDLPFACEQKVVVVNEDKAVQLRVAEGFSADITILFGNVDEPEHDMDWLGGFELFQGETPVAEWSEILIGTGTPWNDNAELIDTSSMTAVGGVFQNVTKTLSFDHLLPGTYALRFHSDSYIMGKKTFTIEDRDVSANLTLTTGTGITGKVVDAESGQALGSSDGIIVSCEAFPWVEGSHKSTEWMQNAFHGTTKQFTLNNLPAGTYLLTVQHESDGASNRNYAATNIFGITITGDESSEVNVGTIKLNQGTTISGYCYDVDGNPLPNIPMEAGPMDIKYGEMWLEAKTDAEGYFSISGIDTAITYWEVTASLRPEPWEFMVPHTGYGEETKYNVVPATHDDYADLEFTLRRTTASLSGTITIPAGQSFAMPGPFDEDGTSMPAALITLQRKGVPSDDPLGDIEAISDMSDTTSATFTIDNLVPDTYRMVVMADGLTTHVGEVVVEGDTTLSSTIVLSLGAKVSGTVTKEDGSNPTTSDLEMPMAMSSDGDELVFGTFTKDADGRITDYEIKGLTPGTTYLVALVSPGEDGPGNIYIQTDDEGNPQAVAPETASTEITLNAVMQESAPVLMMKANKISGTDNLHVEVFATAHLRDESADGMITADGTVSDELLSPDKMFISFTYTPADASATAETITISAHYGEDNELVTKSFTINPAADGFNQGSVNSFMGGTVTMDGGDATGISFGSGTIDDEGNDGTEVNIVKSDVSAAVEQLASARSFTGFGTAAVLLPEATGALPSWATEASQLYSYDIGNDSIASGETATVTLQYTCEDSAATSANLHILHYNETDAEWEVVSSDKRIDTENNTVSVSVSSLSSFTAVTGALPEDATTTTTAPAASSGGGGGGCFISAAH